MPSWQGVPILPIERNSLMKKYVLALSALTAAAALGPAAATSAADPVAAVKADLAKLQADVTAKRNVIVADAQKLAADAAAAKGGTRWPGSIPRAPLGLVSTVLTTISARIKSPSKPA